MNFVSISSDGHTVAANWNTPKTKFGGLGLWTFPEGVYLRSIAGRPLAISADFRYLATETNVLEVQNGKQVIRYRGAAPVAFGPTGEYVVLAGDRGARKGVRRQIAVLRIADGHTVATFGTRYTTALAVHPDNQTLASGHWDNVTLWDLQTGRRLALLAGFGRYVYGIGFSRDGRLLAAGTDSGQLQIWDVSSRTRLRKVDIGIADVSNPAFSPDGKLVAAGTYADGTVSLVEVSSGKILSQIRVSMFGCGSVAFSPDGQYLIIPSTGGQIAPRRFVKGGTIHVFRVRD